jgi:hypothetical protein
VEHVTDDVVKAFWTQEFAKYTDKYTAEATPAIQNKVGQLITSPLIRNIIGQTTSSIDLRRAMDEKKILLINLSKGKIGEENSSLIGSMLVTKLYLAAMTRVDVPFNQRAHFYLYVDEFQSFATPSFANILSEARKYGLCLTLAHQYVSQLDETVRDAIFGNVGTMVAFRIGGADGEIFEREFAPEISTQDFVNAPFAQIYVRLMIDGLTSRPFSATTLPPIPKPAISHKEQVVGSSRKKYGTARAEVTEYIRQWWQPIISEEEKERERLARRNFGEGGQRADRRERREREGPVRRFQENRPPQRPISLYDLQKISGRERPHPGEQKEIHKPPERNLNELREMLSQIRPRNQKPSSQKPDSQNNKESPKELRPGESVKLG